MERLILIRHNIVTIFIMAVTVTMGGCSTLGPAPQSSAPVATSIPAEVQSTFMPAPEQSVSASTLGDQLRRYQGLGDIEHPSIELARDDFLRQDRLGEVLSDRGSYVVPYLLEKIIHRGLPAELIAIPIVESMLDPWAYSSQSAAGLWQISSGTAEHLAMHRSWWFDSRFDIGVATDKALDYLESLNRQFKGDWLLTLAAYNAGPGRVSRALKQSRQKGLADNFWSLRLPRETKQYVPKVLAMAELLATADANALPLIGQPPHSQLVRVNTHGQIDLALAAELAHIDIDVLRRLNPGHLRWATAPDHPHFLVVPADAALSLVRGVSQLPPKDRVRWTHYRIQRGDTLGGIARHFNTSVDVLRAANELNGHFIRAGQSLLIPSGTHSSAQLARHYTPKMRRAEKPSVYTVQRGDSLWGISRRYNIGLPALLKWNNITVSNYLKPGQTLRLSPPTS
jgi:membrane-bound lytic murein transglycosylase D